MLYFNLFTGYSFCFRLKKPHYSSVSALSLPTISSWKNMSFEKRFVKTDVLNRVPLRHQTKQRHLQRDEIQLSSSCRYSMEDKVFKSSHEMYGIYRLFCLLFMYFHLQWRVFKESQGVPLLKLQSILGVAEYLPTKFAEYSPAVWHRGHFTPLTLENLYCYIFIAYPTQCNCQTLKLLCLLLCAVCKDIHCSPPSI